LWGFVFRHILEFLKDGLSTLSELKRPNVTTQTLRPYLVPLVNLDDAVHSRDVIDSWAARQ
jgi:hypothetical protein